MIDAFPYFIPCSGQLKARCANLMKTNCTLKTFHRKHFAVRKMALKKVQRLENIGTFRCTGKVVGSCNNPGQPTESLGNFRGDPEVTNLTYRNPQKPRKMSPPKQSPRIPTTLDNPQNLPEISGVIQQG